MTKFDSVYGPEFDERPYKVHKTDIEPPSSIAVYFNCPWCRVEIKAYVWSFAEVGKRCGCGAIFSYLGMGRKLRSECKN